MQMSFKDALSILDQASKDFKGNRVQHDLISASVKLLAPLVEQADIDAMMPVLTEDESIEYAQPSDQAEG